MFCPIHSGFSAHLLKHVCMSSVCNCSRRSSLKYFNVVGPFGALGTPSKKENERS